MSRKLILVIGATGAQGLAVISSLLAPSTDGAPSPYTVRALTRDTESRRARELRDQGVEIVKGDTSDLTSVASALEGAYGAWVNTDGFTIGEQREIYAGMRIFELAKQTKTLQHYVWSSIDYVFKKGGYDNKYRCEHCDAKGRVAEWMKAQPSGIKGGSDMTWSVVTTGPYMEMLITGMFVPTTRRADGTFVFAAPVGDGHAPMIALADVGYFARYTFDHRAETSGKELEVASEMVGWDHLVATFTKVTGQKAVYKRQTVDEWFDNFENTRRPVAAEGKEGSTSFKENFSGWWSTYRDDILDRDMAWIRETNPNRYTLEKWMVENRYDGSRGSVPILKSVEDGRGLRPTERATQL
ncbi:NAD(P)-binding protein [Gloeopeniophorella convolvens]|nr:NAD(P)-binding protein [Gloeopeniophorella convolvens]